MTKIEPPAGASQDFATYVREYGAQPESEMIRSIAARFEYGAAPSELKLRESAKDYILAKRREIGGGK